MFFYGQKHKNYRKNGQQITEKLLINKIFFTVFFWNMVKMKIKE